MVTRMFLSLVFVFIAPAVWAAGSEPSDASVKQLLEIMQMHKSLNMIGAQMDNMMQKAAEQAANGHPLSSNAKQSVARCRDDLHVTIRDDLSWDKMEPVYVEIYQNTFTQNEINALIAFYKTPLGKSIVVKLPEAMKTAELQTLQTVNQMMNRIREMQREVAEDVQSAK
jgi:hypothetical protein